MAKITSSDHPAVHYFKIALSFAIPKLGLLFVKHPVYVIKTNKQARPDLANTEIISSIYAQNGVRGFYRSTSTSAVKIFVSESYRGVLMIYVPKQMQSYLPESWKTAHPKAVSIASSLMAVPIISLIDATAICPFTRMSTLQITEYGSIQNIYKTHISGNVVRGLYRGYVPLLIQTAFLWTNFFVIDDLSKWVFRKDPKTFSYSEFALSSVFGGSLQTCVNIVPETIRVQMQKPSSHLNMRNTVRQLIRQNGIRPLICAMPHKFLENTISYGCKSALRHVWTRPENENRSVAK